MDTEPRSNKDLFQTLLSDDRYISLISISFIAIFGASAVAPVLPEIASSLNVPESRVGLLMTAFTLPGIVSIPFVGVLADMFGRKTIIIPSLLVFGVSGLGIGFTDDFNLMVLLRVVQGLAAGGITPLTVTIIGDLYTGELGSTALGIRLSAKGTSNVLTPAVAGFLGGMAWYYPFFLYALALPVALGVLLFVPNTAQTFSSDLDWKHELREYRRALTEDIFNPNIGILTFGEFLYGFGHYTVVTFVPLFAVQRLGGSPFIAGLLLSIYGVARILISPLTGPLLKTFSRKQLLVFGLLMLSIGILLITLSPTFVLLGIWIGIFGVGDAIYGPIHRDTITALANETNRAGVVSTMSILGKLGRGGSPVALGIVLAVSGFELVFLLGGSIMAMYAVGVILYLDSNALGNL